VRKTTGGGRGGHSLGCRKCGEGVGWGTASGKWGLRAPWGRARGGGETRVGWSLRCRGGVLGLGAWPNP
jgi:hypothetical protein